ncbi:adapter protein, putative [Theileria equi strain WA]|uniref:Pre-mRNA-splicing factor SYF1 n=1 Tax=Theileria equi strain WA TaxID=1537102 RepID=L0AY72_THEEQ|nr:adapter protein, putative [Theileria equi strain WA]AFZ80532.1 adapter protein, putative [Theileria equi strain WA]|eukprot:XP_004830198.1 adapter protein, putative [Theileria equi strain WA]
MGKDIMPNSGSDAHNSLQKDLGGNKTKGKRSGKTNSNDLAALYDNQFHDVIGRDPYRCKPWIEHTGILKSLRPPRGTRQIFRISEISKLERVHTDNCDSSKPTLATLGDTSYEDINKRLFATYERAIEFIPLSYKVWYQYLKDRVENLSCEFYENPKEYYDINSIFERCIVNLYAYPSIYLLYGSFLQYQNRITKVRRLYDKALLNLAITQHSTIWEQYLKFVDHFDLLPLGRAVFMRYIQLKPNFREVFYDFLKRHKQYDEAAKILCELLNDDNFVSENGKSQYNLWIELCELIRDNSQHIKSIPVDRIIKEGISKYTDQVASLWIILADIYIIRGQLHIARDVYEEALKSVTTVQDFSTIFDVYAKFLENYAKQMNKSKGATIETLITVDRLENLINNRAALLASVKLKQNIHNVYNWVHYTQLFESEPAKVAEIYAEAVQTIDPRRSVGRVTDLWIRFATFYEDRDDLENAIKVYEKATNANFRFVDDLATIWCCWVEMCLRHNNFKEALQIARRAIDPKTDKDASSVSKRIHRSVRLWSLCLDMEENFGTIETCRSTFNRMVELKVVTPQIALNFAMYLEENKYFEGSFNAFERCVALFKWPQLYYLYLPYLTKFVKRYRGSKLERAREIFDQCIHSEESNTCSVPPKFVKYIFYLYAHMEEEFGLINRSLGILRDAARYADKDDQLKLVKLYIAKTTEFYGITHTRKIYKEALEFVDDNATRELCSMYIQMERGLAEIDRARAIYIYCSQFCDPSVHTLFWKDWREFEVLHGNEDCFREMLRIKRSVQAHYSKVHYNTEEINDEDIEGNPLEQLENITN